MRILFVVCLILAMLGSIAQAQVSVGFEDAKDIDNLLDYRLPDWGYKTWDASFGLAGSGYDARIAGDKSINNNFSTSLNTAFRQYRESEYFERLLLAELGGRYSRSHSGDQDSERSGHSLFGDYDVSLSGKRFLGQTPFALIAAVGDARGYRENVTRGRVGDDWDEVEHYSRSNRHVFEIGFGIGRLRDVVPLIRAERLSERMAALGLRRLTAAEAQQVAEVIATEYGYGRVYDRKNRHFWGNVLEPILDVQLTPYQVYYLSEILNENIGYRLEGFSLDATWQYRGYITAGSNYAEDSTSRDRDATIAAKWARNLSLDRQLRIYLAWQYSFRNAGPNRGEFGSLACNVEYLWNVADRHHWTTRLQFDGNSNIVSETREKAIDLDSSWDMRIEDQLTLRVNAGLRYYWRKWHDTSPVEDDITHGWNWGYGVSFVYHLDRVLL